MMQVDVNGDKAPNMYGADIYRFWITKKSADASYAVVPMGAPGDTYAPLPSGCTAGLNGMIYSSGCTYLRLTNPDSMR